MTVSLWRLLALVWVHFVADFIFQTDRMALNKSKDNLALLDHVFIYSLFLLPFGLEFTLANAAAHFATDYVSSRISGHFWKQEKRHWFFVTIGADQAVHLSCLIYFSTLFK